MAVFLCLLIYPGKTAAQTGAEDYIVVNRLTRESGLPDQDINGIYFDSKGFAWISTFGGGLVRYDGDSFIRFSPRTTPEFHSDFVNLCCEDNFGRLWVPCAGVLSIIDLENGSQPIENEDGTLVLVFNGEIYNFQTLRAELIEKGHVFKTHTDSEVLLHGY